MISEHVGYDVWQNTDFTRPTGTTKHPENSSWLAITYTTKWYDSAVDNERVAGSLERDSGGMDYVKRTGDTWLSSIDTIGN